MAASHRTQTFSRTPRATFVGAIADPPTACDTFLGCCYKAPYRYYLWGLGPNEGMFYRVRAPGLRNLS